MRRACPPHDPPPPVALGGTTIIFPTIILRVPPVPPFLSKPFIYFREADAADSLAPPLTTTKLPFG